MKPFLTAVVAIVVIAFAANTGLTTLLDFSAENVYRSENVRLGPSE